MINFHCTIIPVVVLDSAITHTSAWFLDGKVHQLVFYYRQCHILKSKRSLRKGLSALRTYNIEYVHMYVN